MTFNLDKSAWKRVSFGDVVQNLNVSVKDPAAEGIDRVIAMEHLDPGELKIVRWGALQVGTTFTRLVRPGQTLFGKRRAYQRKAAFAEFDAICSGDILVFQADPQRLLPELLPFLVQSNGFYDHALGTSAGSLSPRTNWRDLANFEFDLPPLDDQKRIAQFLHAIADARQSLITERLHVDRTKDAWLETQFGKFFTESHTTLGDLAAQGVVAFLTGPFGSTLSAREYVKQGIPVIHPSHIRDNRVTVDSASTVTADKAATLSRWKVETGDIVLMRKGDVGRSAIITADEAGWILGSDCISVRVDASSNLDPRYLRLALRSPAAMRILLKNAPGTTMPGINERSLKPIPVPYVDTDTQNKLLAEHEIWSRSARALGDEIAILEALKQSALKEAWGEADAAV